MADIIHEQLDRIIERKSTASGLDSLIQGYRLCARTEGKSQKTITITTTAVTTLKNFLEARGLSTDVTDIGTRELREFILHLQQVRAYEHHPYTKLQERTLSGNTVNCYLRATRAFWSWLIREEIILSNPFARVRIPKPPQMVMPTFSQSQIQALLGAIQTHTANGFRDWTMIIMLLDTGLRAGELAGLTLENINLEDGIVKVLGKMKKERMVPIGATVQRAIWKYLQRYRPQPTNPLCSNLFLTRNGQPVTVNRLEAIIEAHSRKAKIEGIRVAPHGFRHTFAISYLRNGADVFTLQRILGHSSLDMVRNYVNMAETDVKACHRRCSPADNMELRRKEHTVKK